MELDIDRIKDDLDKRDIETYVKAYIYMSDNLESSFEAMIEKKLSDTKFKKILEFYDYLSAEITRYFIIRDYKHLLGD